MTASVSQNTLDRRMCPIQGTVSGWLTVIAIGNLSLTNLVDPASCHMLVSRTKPCKCQWTR